MTSSVSGFRAAWSGARPVRSLGLIAAIIFYLSSLPLQAMEETLTVTIDQARLVRVPPGTEALIVGNAAIADVTLLKQGSTMVITGKSFGETNFIALNGEGKTLKESLIRVVGGKNGLLVPTRDGSPILCLRGGAMSAHHEAGRRFQIFQ